MAKEKEPKKIELTEAELASLQKRIKNKTLTDEDIVLFEQVLLFMLWIQRQLERFKLTTHKLRQLIFGEKTEKNERAHAKEENRSLDQDVSLAEEPPSSASAKTE